MRAFWTGDIVFGLVTIPVKLYPATKDLTPAFNQLHIACGSRINMVRRCPKCEKDIEWAEIGKGYEVEKGKYVLFTKEELAKIDGGDEEKGTIEMVQVISLGEIDPAYIDKTYWIGPGGKSAKSARGYELLRTALDEMGKIAVIRVKLRTRPRIGIIQAKGKLFALHTMRFPDELVPSTELAAPDVKPLTDRELEMAHALIKEMVAPFEPAKLPDDYRVKLLAAASAKADGGEGVASDSTAEAKPAEVVDLADLLAASIAKGKKK